MGFWSKFFADTRPWQSMVNAPRDGTPIEIKCTYGYKPWIQIGKWRQDKFSGPIWEFEKKENIVKLSNGNKITGFSTFLPDQNYGSRECGANNSTLQWRPVQ